MTNDLLRSLFRRLGPVLAVVSLALVGFGCQSQPPACGDNADNDRNGLVDSEDPGCADGADTSELSALDCDDAIDDDRDGRTDWASEQGFGDPGCTSLTDPSELATVQCDDGLDNDGDGRRDYSTIRRSDVQCESHTDDLERLAECSDGEDNDGDTYSDFGDGTVTSTGEIVDGDPGCSSPSDDSEAPADPPRQYGDGLDDDEDGLVDEADCVTP